MARLARVVIPGIPHHIVQRGNRSQKVFFSDEDRRAYLRILHTNTLEYNIRIIAYCLMDNHVHLIAIPHDDTGLARGIGKAHKEYTRLINFREGWRGYLWQGRFSSFPLDTKHLFAAIRYVEDNPVRAGIVSCPEEYEWSSAEYHRTGKELQLLSTHEDVIPINELRSFLRNDKHDRDVTVFRKLARTGRPMGDDRFIDAIEQMTGRTLRPQRAGRKKTSIVSPGKADVKYFIHAFGCQIVHPEKRVRKSAFSI